MAPTVRIVSPDHVVRCQHPDIHIPDNLSFGEMILRKAGTYGDTAAFIDAHSNNKMTFAELEVNIRRYSSVMAARGYKKGDVILFYAPNGIYYPVAIYGNAYLGLISSTANPHYTPEELRYMIDDSQPVCIITMPTLLPKVKDAIKGYTRIKDIIVLQGYYQGCIALADILKEGDEHFRSAVHINPKEDPCLLPYSSGTTGRSKGVCLTHYNMVANVHQSSVPTFNYPAPNTTVTFLPFYHSFALGVILGSAIYQGTTVVVLEAFDFELYLKTIQRYKATFLHIVPPVAVLLAKDPLTPRYDLTSVRSLYSGAGPIGEETERQALEQSAIQYFRQGYGLTETSPVMSMHPIVSEKSKQGSSGMPCPNTEVLVVDIEKRVSLGPHEDGEVLTRGPQVMKGYWKRPQATAECMTPDEWLLTGDIGHYDEDGYIYIVDRLKELIKWKGLQVPPADLEHVILKYPDVADVAVIGVPDLEAGELPRAYIVLKDGAKATAEQIMNFVKDNVSAHKRLRGGVEFVNEIPKSPSGKILRRILKDRLKLETKSKL